MYLSSEIYSHMQASNQGLISGGEVTHTLKGVRYGCAKSSKNLGYFSMEMLHFETKYKFITVSEKLRTLQSCGLCNLLQT